MILKCKFLVAKLFSLLGISQFLINKNKNKNYVRVINYHNTPEAYKDHFEQQLLYFIKNFTVISELDFYRFLKGEISFEDKPGLLLTFDDGTIDNLEVAAKVLNKYRLSGLFFVFAQNLVEPSDIYMNHDQVIQLLRQGHTVGSHTYSHHRMAEEDTDSILHKEIADSKRVIEEHIKSPISSFCWCGGELNTYTEIAANIIRQNYQYAYMTNCSPVFSGTNTFQIQRTNIEYHFPIAMIQFQLCGIMDKLYQKKRNTVNEITK